MHFHPCCRNRFCQNGLSSLCAPGSFSNTTGLISCFPCEKGFATAANGRLLEYVLRNGIDRVADRRSASLPRMRIWQVRGSRRIDCLYRLPARCCSFGAGFLRLQTVSCCTRYALQINSRSAAAFLGSSRTPRVCATASMRLPAASCRNTAHSDQHHAIGARAWFAR